MDNQNELHWPELDEAIRKDKEEREKAWRAVEAELFADELVEKLPLILQAQRVSDSIAGHEDELYALIQQWYLPVRDYFQRMALARSYRFKGHFRELIIANEDHHSHALYWEAMGGQMYVTFFYSVRLVTDESYRSLHFLVECNVDGNYLVVEPDIKALKCTLLEAYKFGTVNEKNREEVAGVDIYRFLKTYKQS